MQNYPIRPLDVSIQIVGHRDVSRLTRPEMGWASELASINPKMARPQPDARARHCRDQRPDVVHRELPMNFRLHPVSGDFLETEWYEKRIHRYEIRMSYSYGLFPMDFDVADRRIKRV